MNEYGVNIHPSLECHYSRVVDNVIEGDPERGIEATCPGLPDWEALNDCVDVFATSESGGKGRYVSGDGSWGKLYGDEQRIENLDLDYEIHFAGSEAAMAAEIKRAYDRGEPILSLIWRPHWVTSAMDLTLVEFPEYTDEYWGTTYACAWDDISMRKMVGKDFPEANPTAYKFLENYDLNDEHLGTILVAMEEDGLTLQDAVDQWMEEHPDVWSEWIPDSPA